MEKTDKMYRVLAKQLDISTSKAKELIDKGVVFYKGQKATIARADIPLDAVLRVEEIEKPKVIFEDAKLLALSKPPFIDSEQIAKNYNLTLLHRLDRETSGILLLTKDEDFRILAIKEFQKRTVYKEYAALVPGIIAEGQTISAPLKTIKKGYAKSVVDKKGEEAITQIEPLEIIGKKTLLKVIIETGRTHQIRAHLAHIGYAIEGDTFYGGRAARRVMLHSHKMKLLDYDFTSPVPKDFYLNS
jgi:23S rRNA-/tRNA-specific pseudouridylate synthase